MTNPQNDPYTGLPYSTPGPAFSGYVPQPPAGDPILVSIGDIHCTRTQVLTPVGSYPIAGTQWSFADLSRTTREIPQWAIIVAIVTAILLCGLGLLFLLVKEDRTVGFVQVTVAGNGLMHTTSIPVSSPAAVADLGARVNYAQGLAHEI